MYTEDNWNYDKGSGGGRTRVWEGGKVLEKAGVNFSSLQGGSLPASAATAIKIPPGTPFSATGVSIVIHPRNPHVPTIHMVSLHSHTLHFSLSPSAHTRTHTEHSSL